MVSEIQKINDATKAIAKRNNRIYKNYLEGKTRTELANEHNLSPERIRQICNRLKMQRSKTTLDSPLTQTYYSPS
jgi:Mor family transcriptional regulator